jgi:hypothetical protein
MDVKLKRRDLGPRPSDETKDARPTSSARDAPDTRRTRERSTLANQEIVSSKVGGCALKALCVCTMGWRELVNFLQFSSEGAKGKWAFIYLAGLPLCRPEAAN